MSSLACVACGHVVVRWLGQCPGCKRWDTIAAHTAAPLDRGERDSDDLPIIRIEGTTATASTPVELGAVSFADVEIEAPAKPVRITNVDLESIEARDMTGLAPFDDVLGGGLVTGSCILLGGDPGAGKSSMLIQALAGASRWAELRVLYATGEESVGQVAMRARRLKSLYDQIYIVAEVDVSTILEHAATVEADIIAIDSISTMTLPELSGAPGSVTQVRACAEALRKYAKATDTTLIMICHVTKDGATAGPKAVEHLVDAVLHLEVPSDSSPRRILRARKNRHGNTAVVGQLRMTDDGLRDLKEDELPEAVRVSDDTAQAS